VVDAGSDEEGRRTEGEKDWMSEEEDLKRRRVCSREGRRIEYKCLVSPSPRLPVSPVCCWRRTRNAFWPWPGFESLSGEGDGHFQVSLPRPITAPLYGMSHDSSHSPNCATPRVPLVHCTAIRSFIHPIAPFLEPAPSSLSSSSAFHQYTSVRQLALLREYCFTCTEDDTNSFGLR